MTLLFRLSNMLVLPFWALMILLPRWRWTGRIMRSPFVSAAPALLYAALVLPRLGTIWPAIARPTLTGVAALLGSPEGATIAWVHFLAFDLFIGRWIFLDSQERRLSPLLTAPVLFLTLMLGPLGFLTYLAIRAVSRSREAGKARTQTSAARVNTTESSIKGTQLGLRTGDPGKTLLRRAWRTNPPLTLLGVTMILVFLGTLAGILLDHRVITGAPAWLKPAKFAVSVSVYCFTFVWLLGFVESRPRLARFAANLTVVSFIVEMTVILTQAARGTTSHFNLTTPLNTFLWLAMGAFIVVVWTMNLLLAILLLFERIPNRPFAWSLRLGLLVSLVGMGSGFLMVRPTHEQLLAMAANHGPRIVGAHSVGVADGGPGLPVVGWSTAGGDFRVGHFVGIHAMQVLPFLGWLIASRRNAFARFKDAHRLALISTVGFAYLGLVLLLIWQALRGQSLIHPDVQTLVATAALLALTGLSAWLIAAHAKRMDTDSSGLTEGRPPMAVNAAPSKSRKKERKGPMNRRTIKISQVAAAILSLWLSAPCAPLTAQTKDTGTLTVRIAGARNTKGKIGVTLFQGAQGFPDDTSKAIRQQSVDIDPNAMSAQVTFKDLPQGTFAVSILHDENGNGKMDKNFVGMPKEGYGASNNPTKKKRAPTFDEAKFSLNASEQTIEITLIY